MWRCPKCGEESEDQFDACWNCGVEKASSKGADQNAGSEPGLQSAVGRGETEPRRPTGLARRYADAYATANALVGLGRIIKGIGVVLAVLIGLLFLVVGSETNASIGVAGAAAGVALGVVIYLLGVFPAALGEILKATLDTAVNTSPFLNDEARKNVMSLP